MFTDKLTLAIAEAAKKCMDEELVGNQRKIDANKNGKVDAHDFKLLRKGNKVSEELKGDQHKIDANKNGKIDAHDFKILRKEDTVDEAAIDDLRDRQAAAREVNSYKASDKKQDPTKRTVQGHQYGGTKQKPETDIEEAMSNPGLESLASKVRAARTGKPSNPALEKIAHEKAKAKYLNKEDVEQIEESGGKVVFTSGDDHIEAYGEDAFAVYKNNKKQKYYSSLSAAKEALKEEKMSDEDMTQREKIVKGMKKNLQGFKSRYGADAEKVMYATATKQAMKEGAVPSTEKTVTVKHKTSGKEMVVTANSAAKYKSLGYHPVKEEAEQIIEREESPTKGTRKIASYGDHAHTAEVRYNPEYQEYQVHHYKAGKHQGEGPVSYHYDDKADAHSTAKHSVGIKESVVAEEANPTGVKTYHKNKDTGKEHATTNFTAKAAAEHEKELKKAGHTITGRALMFGAKEGPRRNVNEEVELDESVSTRKVTTPHGHEYLNVTDKEHNHKFSFSPLHQHKALALKDGEEDKEMGIKRQGENIQATHAKTGKTSAVPRSKFTDHMTKANEEVEQIDEISTETLKSYERKVSDIVGGTGSYGLKYGSASKQRIKNLMKAKYKLADRQASDNGVKEEVEQIDELSKTTLGSYVNNAARSVRAQAKLGAEFGAQSDKDYSKGDMTSYKIRQDIKKDFEAGAAKRIRGIKTAVGKLTKEGVELDEAQMTQAQLMKKIKDGTHEAMTDIKPGKHVEVRRTATGKRSIVMVREDVEQIDEVTSRTKADMTSPEVIAQKYSMYSNDTLKTLHAKSGDFRAKRELAKRNVKEAKEETKYHVKASTSGDIYSTHATRAEAEAAKAKYWKDNKDSYVVKEEAEELDELSNDKLGRYLDQAQGDHAHQNMGRRNTSGEQQKEFARKEALRKKGISQAVNKLNKEEVELDEASIKLFMGKYQVWHKGNKVASYNSKTDAQDHANSLKEEVTNDDFKTELEDNKAKAAGTKKQPDIAKASVQAVKQESFSSKLTALKEGVRSYLKGRDNG